MPFEASHGGPDITAGVRREDLSMFPLGVRLVAHERDVDTLVAFNVRAERVDQGQKARAISWDVEDGVKLPVEFAPSGHVAREVDGVENLLGALEIAFRDLRDSQADRGGLQGDTDLVDFLDFPIGQRRDRRAAMRVENDKALGFKLPKGLANRNPAYAQVSGNLVLSELFSPLQDTEQDSLP